MWCGWATDSGVAAGIGLAVWTCYSGGLLRGLTWIGPGYFFGCCLSVWVAV